MTTLDDPSVCGPHPDGSYTVVPDQPGDADWLIRDAGDGWTATHPADGWWDFPDGSPCRWATPSDAAAAILGDPSDTVLFDGRRYREVFG